MKFTGYFRIGKRIDVLYTTYRTNVKAKIFKLRKQGKSIREIANILGKGKTTIWHHLYPEKSRASHRRRKDAFKKELIMAAGGKCKICGYSKCLSALNFHHPNPSKKEFSIADGRRLGIDKDLIKKEAKKCVLLCSNCHHEVHEGMAFLQGIEPWPAA